MENVQIVSITETIWLDYSLSFCKLALMFTLKSANFCIFSLSVSWLAWQRLLPSSKVHLVFPSETLYRNLLLPPPFSFPLPQMNLLCLCIEGQVPIIVQTLTLLLLTFFTLLYTILPKVTFIQGAFKNIQGLLKKIQGLFKDIPQFSNFQRLFKARANHDLCQSAFYIDFFNADIQISET